MVVVNLDSLAGFPQCLSYDLSAKERSMKKTRASGGFEPELAADGLFDLVARAAIILRQLVDRFSGFVTFRYNRCGNPCPNQNWPSIRDARIDDDNFWLAQVALARRRIKSNRSSGCIVLDAMKLSF